MKIVARVEPLAQRLGSRVRPAKLVDLVMEFDREGGVISGRGQ
ncbi:MAG: hypothetical protein ACI91F_002459 [Candidatus Binatia bacterium]|jgi:hypothetical protein